MRVLVSDPLHEIGINLFKEEEGIQVDVKTGMSPDELKSVIGKYQALVIRSATKVTVEVLQQAGALKVIGRAGIGLDNVDVPEATKRGIVVMNTPTGNIITTAEHAIAMMMALSRNIPEGTTSLKAGRWDKKKLQGREVYNKIMGIIGFGKIGAIVADRARGLRMRVVVHDPLVPAEQIEEAGFESVSLEALYRKADYISVHVPKMKETIGLLNKAAFDKMKDGVMIINCARGGIVDESDLSAALQSGKVGGAALDVFETEPPGVCTLLDDNRVICTPHLGASTREAQVNVAVAVARQIIDYLKNGTVTNAVNAPSVSAEVLNVVGPYLQLADRMGCMLAQLCRGAIQEITIGYAGDFKTFDSKPVSTAFLKGLLTPMVKDDVNFVNAGMLAKERGIRVSEKMSPEAGSYLHLMKARAKTTEMTQRIAGTIFGKSKPQIVAVDDFQLSLEPVGHFACIQCANRPGAFGSITALLGDHDININRMSVGTRDPGHSNIVFLSTDTVIPDAVSTAIQELPLVEDIRLLEL